MTVFLRIEVVHSPAPRVVESRTLELPDGATVAQALQACGLWPIPEGADRPDGIPVGVWGRRRPPGHRLRDGDRVELYRPLQVDPKEARRRRVQGQRADRRSRRG
jgi:putative ubiquitin-RnfH superfamily antitoxin RatB of RatAB toxin-antitoxin module